MKLNKDAKDALNGVFAVSLVARPAVQVNFVKLEEKEQQRTFALSDKEQRIISGVALVPEKKIYRPAEDLGGEEDGYIFFSRETVKECSELFLKELRNNNATLDHNEETNDLTLTESWIVDNPECDKAKHLGLDVPAGSWCLSYRVNNDELWDQIKEGRYNGFSIEARMTASLISKLSESQKPRPQSVVVQDIMNTIEDFLKQNGQTSM